MVHSSSGRWRRVFHWPVFCLLAFVHLLVLPVAVLDGDDAAVSILAGFAYLAFAVADRRGRDRSHCEGGACRPDWH